MAGKPAQEPGRWPQEASWCVSRAIPKAVILAREVGRHSTIRRIASRHYSALRDRCACAGIAACEFDAAAASLRFEIAASTFLDRKIIQETRFRA
jgi:hypothetical protein